MKQIGKFPPVQLSLMPLVPRAKNSSLPSSAKCETQLQLGIFFDGTGNNRELDRHDFSDSNIARLADAYLDAKGRSKPIYVPGVGTPFPIIGESGESWQGRAYGKGCESRVLFGLLKVLDELYRCVVSSQVMFSDEQIRLLCTRSELKPYERTKVRKFGTDFGLIQEGYGSSLRRAFLKARVDELRTKLDSTSIPSLRYCVLDVFGFSRGAATARVFCSWLNEIIQNGEIAGVPIQIRFLGIFDTVASAGLTEMSLGATSDYTGGHQGWAEASALRIPPLVRNCVHFIAMHELRKSFPLDEISVGGNLPPGSLEIAYPGSHSDVGGGYGPGQLGVAKLSPLTVADSSKLAQIPLNHMYEYASACGVPLDKSLAKAKRNNFDPFLVSDQLRKDFERFLRETGNQPKAAFEWAKFYLSWRWQMRNQYNTLCQVRSATGEDRKLLEKANAKLKDDAELIRRCGGMSSATKFKELTLKGRRKPRLKRNFILCSDVDDLEPEAPLVLREAQETVCPPALAEFFDKYVHDSYAGFGSVALEPTGYWRYRRSFQGSDFDTFAIENTQEQEASTS
jgi:hypothetical protein